MSSPGRRQDSSGDLEPASKGPNLFLIYALLLLAILGAMAFAAMIVFPFYNRR